MENVRVSKRLDMTLHECRSSSLLQCPRTAQHSTADSRRTGGFQTHVAQAGIKADWFPSPSSSLNQLQEPSIPLTEKPYSYHLSSINLFEKILLHHINQHVSL